MSKFKIGDRVREQSLYGTVIGFTPNKCCIVQFDETPFLRQYRDYYSNPFLILVESGPWSDFEERIKDRIV